MDNIIVKIPQVGVGALILQDNKVLLVKRAKPPSVGLWTIPGGKVKLGETLQQAAEREVKEETTVKIKAGSPIYVFDVMHTPEHKNGYHYVVIDLLAEYVSGEVHAQDDASDAAWFGVEQWGDSIIDNNTRQFLKMWQAGKIKSLGIDL